MIDPLIIIGVVSGWAVIVAAVYQMLRSEVWHVREENKTFDRDNAQMVNRLKSKAELSLAATVYNLETLKKIFTQPHAASNKTSPLTQIELTKAGEELATFTKGLGDVKEPKTLYESICADYTERVKLLKTLIHGGIATSAIIPISFIAVDLVPAGAWGFVVLLAILVVYLGAIGSIPTYRKYNQTYNRQDKNLERLRQLVNERIYEVGTEESTGPPAIDSKGPDAAGIVEQSRLDEFPQAHAPSTVPASTQEDEPEN